MARGVALWAVLGLALAGCRVAQETARLPVQMVSAVVPGRESVPPDPAALQAELQRYANDFAGRMTAGLDEYAHRTSTREAQDRALKWKVSLTSSALTIATGPNPRANLLDFVTLASLTRSFVEERADDVVPPGAFDPWLHSCRVLETNAWTLAGRILTPNQQHELRTAIEGWRTDNVRAGEAFFARPQEFASDIRQTGEKQGKPGSVFSLVGLDPTAGLDPAVREVTRSRLFAERALFAVQHLPFLLRWQTELLAEQLLRQEQLTNVVASADRLSRAAESASQTAAELPDRVTAEREAILAALEAQEGRLRELAAEVSRTLQAGERMSASLNTTLLTFDALMRRFGVGEAPQHPADTNRPPFNILDYARTAEQIAVMAQQLDTLLKDAGGTLDTPALDQRVASLKALSAQAKADARSVLNHAFLQAAGLVVLVLVCALIYRRFSRGPR